MTGARVRMRRGLGVWLCTVGIAMGSAVTAAHPTDCTLQLEGIHGALEHGSPLLRGYRAVDQRHAPERRFSESAVLRDGTTVAFETGGCTHIAYELTYGHLGAHYPNTAHELLSLGLTLLAKTPFRADFPHAALWGHRLQAAQAHNAPLQNGTITLDCGDATCALQHLPTGQLQLTYDFAL